MSAGRIFVIGSTALVVAVVLVGVFLTGSPRQARMHSLDRQRVEALTQLSGAIISYHRDHAALPASLGEAARAEAGIATADLTDPETGAPYEYRTTGADAYELCARFEGPSAADEDLRWKHGSGRACFAFAAPPLRPSPLAGEGTISPP